ncbi:MAG TPA: universal stress protein [Nocardioides sp.]|nr:universal stress protein [Nocardioides sp.]
MATVVIGYVTRAEGGAALSAGLEEARRRDAKVVLVHGSEGDRGADLETARSALDGAGLAHEVRDLSAGDDVSDVLIAAAEDTGAELIVIGLRRRSPVGKLILGTNAQRVLLDAPCPVLTVKP